MRGVVSVRGGCDYARKHDGISEMAPHTPTAKQPNPHKQLWAGGAHFQPITELVKSKHTDKTLLGMCRSIQASPQHHPQETQTCSLLLSEQAPIPHALISLPTIPWCISPSVPLAVMTSPCDTHSPSFRLISVSEVFRAQGTQACNSRAHPRSPPDHPGPPRKPSPHLLSFKPGKQENSPHMASSSPRTHLHKHHKFTVHHLDDIRQAP